jgi:hypothetical protein
MDTAKEVLITIATILDRLEFAGGLAIPAVHMERASGGTGSVAIAKVEVFARVHGCTFEYDRAKQQEMYARQHPRGERF